MALLSRERKLDPDRCQQTVMSGWHAYQCQRKAGASGYCTQHDPARLQAKADAKAAANADWQHRSLRTQSRGEALLTAAGLKGSVFYSYDRVDPGYRATVLLSFDELEALIDRLRQAGVLSSHG